SYLAVLPGSVRLGGQSPFRCVQHRAGSFIWFWGPVYPLRTCIKWVEVFHHHTSSPVDQFTSGPLWWLRTQHLNESSPHAPGNRQNPRGRGQGTAIPVPGQGEPATQGGP